jgi:hypothetical protein
MKKNFAVRHFNFLYQLKHTNTMNRKFGNYHSQKEQAYSLILATLKREREEAIQKGYTWTKHRLTDRIEEVTRLRNHHYIRAKGLN